MPNRIKSQLETQVERGKMRESEEKRGTPTETVGGQLSPTL